MEQKFPSHEVLHIELLEYDYPADTFSIGKTDRNYDIQTEILQSGTEYRFIVTLTLDLTNNGERVLHAKSKSQYQLMNINLATNLNFFIMLVDKSVSHLQGILKVKLKDTKQAMSHSYIQEPPYAPTKESIRLRLQQLFN